jgi:hypothetical protein
MINFLTARQVSILKSLCLKGDDTDKVLFSKISQSTLDSNDIERLCSIINNEFMMEGILPNYEPNAYGIELEELLDIVNKPRLRD